MKLHRNKKDKSTFVDHLAKTLATTAKQLIWVFSINGIMWIWCSYILAFRGQNQIAEALSSNVCTIVLGQVGFYLVTKTVENVFQYNDIFGPKANGIIAPIPAQSVGSDLFPETPIVRTTSPSISVENIFNAEEDQNVSAQLDIGAAEEPDDAG